MHGKKCPARAEGHFCGAEKEKRAGGGQAFAGGGGFSRGGSKPLSPLWGMRRLSVFVPALCAAASNQGAAGKKTFG